MIEMYKGIVNSPVAELTEAISESATIIKVNNINAFPDAPNLATIGTEDDAETIVYAAKTAEALSGCQRGVQGIAKAWKTGDKIARNFTQKDHADLIDNLIELDNKIKLSGSSNQSSITTFGPNRIVKENQINRVITIFNADGSITEEVRAKEGDALISTKTTTFEADGSIKEVIS